jgi:hypothetical protein
MEAFQQKIIESKMNERTKALKVVKSLLKEFSFTAGVHKCSLSELRRVK